MTGGVSGEAPTRNVNNMSVQVAPGTSGGEAATKTFIPHYFAGIPAYTTYFYIPAPNENTGADKTPLFVKITEALDRIDSGLYTKDSTDALQAVLKAAASVYQSAEVMETEIEAEITRIDTAMQNLEANAIDISKLTEKLAEVSQYKEADYTPETYAELAKAVTAADAYVKGTGHTDKLTADHITAINLAVGKLVKLDRQALQTALEAASQRKNPKNEGEKLWEEHEYTQYTRKSWNSFKAAEESARKLYENDPKVPTQSEIDTATDGLNKAMDALLVYNLCDEREPLEAILKEAKAYKNDSMQYDADAFANLQEMIVLGEERLEYASLTFPERDGCINDIRKAIQALAGSVKVDKSALAAAIADARSKKEADYTADSWKKMQNALAAANTVNGNANATQAQVNEAAKNLQDAIKALKKAVPAVGTPSSLKAAWAGAKKVKVTWKKASNADRYLIYRSYKKTSGYKKIGQTTKTAYTDTAATPGKTAYYKVIAYKGKTKGGYTGPKSAYILKAPGSVKAKASGKNVTVSFGKVSKASGYTIYRSTKKNGTYKRVANLKSAKTIRKRFAKMKKGTYYYKVKAYRKTGGKTLFTGYSSAVKVKVK